MTKKTEAAEIKNVATSETPVSETAVSTTAPETSVATIEDDLSLDLLLAALEGNPDENNVGEDFGGQHERIILEVGQWSNSYAFLRFETITTETNEDGDAVDSFKVPLCREVVGLNPDKSLKFGKIVALPAAATLKRVFKDAEIGVGDVFRARRDEDATKKSGKGKGTKMEVYGIRVILRAAK